MYQFNLPPFPDSSFSVEAMGAHHSKPEFGSNTSIRSSQRQAVQGSFDFAEERSDEFWFNRSGYRPVLANDRDGLPFKVGPYKPDLKPPGSQSHVDKPHPQAWTPQEILERLAVTRGVTDWTSNYRCEFGGPFEYNERSVDHPALRLKLATAPHNEEWRQYIQRWVDDVARWKRIKDAVDNMARKREIEQPQGNSLDGDGIRETESKDCG